MNWSVVAETGKIEIGAAWRAGYGAGTALLLVLAAPALHARDNASPNDPRTTARRQDDGAARPAPSDAAPDSTPPASTPSDSPQADTAMPDVPQPPPGADLPRVEPVVSDREFAETVPPLPPGQDDALNAPLESIAAFEQRIAAEQAGPDGQTTSQTASQTGSQTASQTGAQTGTQTGTGPGQTTDDAAPLGRPELADGDTTEEIGDAPVRDAELTAPLPPIGQFDVEPVQVAQDDGDAGDTEVAYSVRVNGLDQVDDEAKADLAAMFDDLSALKDGDGKAANVAQVSARLTEDSTLLQRILASQGWYGASVTTSVDRSDQPGGQPLTAVLDVVPGQRYSFARIDIRADPTVPPALLRDNLPLRVGEPIVAERVQGAEARLAVALPENGYPFAQLGERDILLDQDTADGVYTLPVEIGPRSRFGTIATTGDLAFDAAHVGVLARFKQGELYDSRDIDDLRKALVATGLFNTVSVTPQKTGRDAGDDTQYADILVEQEAGPPRTLAGSGGYGTGQGIRLEGSWTHRNLFPPEGALIATGVAGTQEQSAGATFRRSNAGRRDRTFQASAQVSHTDYDAYEAFTGQLSAIVSYDSTPIWQKPFTYAYGGRLIGTNEQDYDFDLGELRRRTFFIAGLTGQVGIDRTDSLLNATHGFRATLLVEPEGSLQDGFTPYVRALLDASAYLNPADSIVLAGRVRFGTIQGISRFDLAPSRRFYAGGGGSVRGYGFQQLGPKVDVPNPDYDPDDPDNGEDQFYLRPVGGRSVNEAAAEVRYRFGNFGVVGFVDAGQVYENTLPQLSDIRFGVGLGARYYTNFGPLRLDVATPIDRQPGESRINVYVSIGQAF